MTPRLPPAIAAQVHAASGVVAQHLGDTLLALHLYGSAVEAGGLRPLSDIDLMATVSQPPSAATRRALMHALLAVSAPPGSDAGLRALELTVLCLPELRPWRYAPRRELQFGEWLRGDLEQGRDEPPMRDPDLAVLITQLRAHSLALHGPDAVRLFDPVPAADVRRALADTLALWHVPADWQGDERHVLLTLARIWFTASTGQFTAKDAAADWALARLPAAPQPVLAQARAEYLGEVAPGSAPWPAEAMAAVVHTVKARVAAQASAAGMDAPGARSSHP